jgi:hypothetical protein
MSRSGIQKKDYCQDWIPAFAGMTVFSGSLSLWGRELE